MVFSTAGKFFYYSNTGEAVFEGGIRVVLEEKLDLDSFKSAVGYALRLYPELCFRVKVADNRLICEENGLSPVFVPDSDRRYCYGSEETNGHMLFFSYSDCSFTMHFFHGWSDFAGFNVYLKAVLYRYAVLTGFELSKEELAELLPSVRTAVPDLSVQDIEDRFDPYVKYMDGSAARAPGDFGPAYSISFNQFPHGCGYTNSCTLEMRTSDFIAAAKRSGVSFVPLLVDSISSGVRKGYQTGDATVTVMVPVNLRPLFGSSTVTNFSDGILIPYSGADALKTDRQRRAGFRQIMKSQISRENFARVLYDKVDTVRGFEEDPRSVYEIAAEKRRLRIPGAPSPVTYSMSYIGKISFSSGLDRMVRDIRVESFNRVHCLFVYTFKDTMRFFAINRTDETVFFDCIRNGLNETGFQASVVDTGYRYANGFSLEKLL